MQVCPLNDWNIPHVPQHCFNAPNFLALRTLPDKDTNKSCNVIWTLMSGHFLLDMFPHFQLYCRLKWYAIWISLVGSNLCSTLFIFIPFHIELKDILANVFFTHCLNMYASINDLITLEKESSIPRSIQNIMFKMSFLVNN